MAIPQWLIITVPSLITIIGFIVTIRNSNAQIRSAFSQHEARLSAENKRQLELTLSKKAEETFSIIQEIISEAQLIVREVTIFNSGSRWSGQELQAAYWRLLKPINRMSLLLQLYFPRFIKTKSDEIAAGYNLVADLRDYASQYMIIADGNQNYSGAELLGISKKVLDYSSFSESFERRIDKLNSFLEVFAREVCPLLTTDSFIIEK
jgi:hypothetical protein